MQSQPSSTPFTFVDPDDDIDDKKGAGFRAAPRTLAELQMSQPSAASVQQSQATGLPEGTSTVLQAATSERMARVLEARAQASTASGVPTSQRTLTPLSPSIPTSLVTPATAEEAPSPANGISPEKMKEKLRQSAIDAMDEVPPDGFSLPGGGASGGAKKPGRTPLARQVFDRAEQKLVQQMLPQQRQQQQPPAGGFDFDPRYTPLTPEQQFLYARGVEAGMEAGATAGTGMGIFVGVSSALVLGLTCYGVYRLFLAPPSPPKPTRLEL